MRTLQSLPPLFLLPSWSKSQLLNFCVPWHATATVHRQPARRTHTGDNGERRRDRPLIRKHLRPALGQHKPSGRTEPPGTEEKKADAEAPRRPRPKVQIHNVAEREGPKREQVDKAKDILSVLEEPVKSFGHEDTSTPVANTDSLSEFIKSRMPTTPLPAPPQLPNTPPPKKLSLYEELFPNAAKARKEPPQPRHQPPKPGFIGLDTQTPALQTPDLNQNSSPTPSPASHLSNARWKADRATVMFIAGASTDLSPADFHRLVPRSSHIDGWRAPGTFLHIIPGRAHQRSPESLAPRRWYMLVFDNPPSARAYKDSVLHAHALAQKYRPSPSRSPRLPERDHGVKGDDVRSIVESYTLYPPSAEPDIRILSHEERDTVQKLLEHKGYQILEGTAQRPKSGRSVRLWVDGFQAKREQIVGMLSKAGRERGVQWSCFDGSGRGEMVLLSGPAGASVGGLAGGSTSNDNDRGGYEDEGEDENQDEKHKKRKVSRWLLSFADEAEARRFVRTWHLRPFRVPLVETQDLEGEPLPRVYAEFVW